jgi:hypothetical protein
MGRFCELLFVHRDAEGQAAEMRRAEIAEALGLAQISQVPVVPFPMIEAWLLADEMAIGSAAGNPRGTAELNLPELRKLEGVPDPKQALYQALVTASGLNTQPIPFYLLATNYQITNYIDDYSNLEVLSAFQRLQDDVRAI